MRGWPTYGILTNLDCNLNCSYCYEHQKRPKVINKDSVKSFINAIYYEDYVERNKPKCMNMHIDLIGGECFLHPEILVCICEECSKLDAQYQVLNPYSIAITTNATLLSRKDSVDFLTKYKDHIKLGFSIDGTKEIHNLSRLDYSGKGSYDLAIEGLKIAQKILPSSNIRCKATFTHETIFKYADSVINLIQLGFKRIAANVVFFEEWKPEESKFILQELIKVTNYMLENDLIYKINVQQINPEYMEPLKFQGKAIKCQNWCGSCTYMRTLGFDNNIYGCHRMATSNLPAIGKLINDKIVITNQELIDEVTNQYNMLPQECKDCDISGHCPSCSVEAYDYDGTVSEFLQKKTQCGWTIATVAVREYLKLILENNTKFIDEDGKEIQVL